VENGILQIGADNVLPVAAPLTTRFAGVFDLNGHDQEVSALQGDGGSVNNGAFDNNTLTVNQATDTTYAGQIAGNVIFRKKGAGKLTFTNVNTHRGGTVLEGGTISISQAESLGQVATVFRADAVRFNGGALEVTASTTLDARNGITVEAGGGTITTTSGKTFTIDSPITGAGDLILAGAGDVEMGGVGSDLRGTIHITAGTLRATNNNTISPQARVEVTGDSPTAFGTLDLDVYNQSIGSLSSIGAAQANASVLIGDSELTVGGDNTSGAVYAGAITGGGVFRVNTLGAQTLSTMDNSAEAWSTEIANGRLSLANGAKPGSADITLNVATYTGADDKTVLDLQGTDIDNNVTVNGDNTKGVSVIQASTAADSSISGAIAIARDIFTGASVGQKLTLSGDVSGSGRLTVVDGGAVVLNGNNAYGTGVSGVAGVAIDGGTVVRAGTVSVGNSNGLGAKHVELGDTRVVMTTLVDRATTASVLANGGTYTATGGLSQTGSFTGVSSTVDGHVYTLGDVGTTILVKDEEADPASNGIYTITGVSGATMTLERNADFDTPREMTYGKQFTVVNGTSATKSFFMMEPGSANCCLPALDPIRFREEAGTSNVALLLNTGSLTVANDIDVNATAGTGSVTIGGDAAFTSGASTFGGNIVLQNLQSGATGVETKTVTLTSSTNGSGTGVTFSGAISEADAANDTLSVEKTGTGTVTLTGTDTYHGTTAITNGTLQLGTGGSINDTTFIRVDTGATFGTPAGGYTTDATVSGSGTISGDLTIDSNVGSINTTGVLKPGDSTGGLLANAGDQVGTLTVTGNLTLAAATGGATRLEMQLGSTLAADANEAAQFTTRLGNGTFDSWITDNTDGHITSWEAGTGNHDRLNISGTLNLTATGQISITNPGSYTAAIGDVFDLIDWTTLNAGTFNFGGTYRGDGLIGDLALPTLGAGLAWNTALFQTNGILVVVPEPSRALFLMLGLLAVCLRRRRRHSM